MRKVIIMLAACLSVILALSACQMDDPWEFDYPKEVLCGGVWCSDAIRSKGEWVDITGAAFRDLQFTISFSTDGTYSGTGYFGTGKGTYEARGKVIKTFVDGELYYTYTVYSMAGDVAELSMKGNSSTTLDIRVRKL